MRRRRNEITDEIHILTVTLLCQRATSALHLNEQTWIIDGFNELIVDFLFALILFLDSTQPRPPQKSEMNHFFLSNKQM